MLSRKHWRVVVGSLVALACLAGARPDRVLCTGQGNHVEIEQAVHGVCADAESVPPASGSGMAASRHCGPCVDVPLGNFLAVRAPISRDVLDGAAPACATSQTNAVPPTTHTAGPGVFLNPMPDNGNARILRI